MTIQFDEALQNQKIEHIKLAEEEELAEILATRYGLNYINLMEIPINLDALRLIPEKEARANSIAVFDAINRKLKVAILSPNKDATAESLKFLIDHGYEPSIYMVSQHSLEKALSRYADLQLAIQTKAGTLDISEEELNRTLNDIKTVNDITQKINEILATKNTFVISRIVEIIMAGGVKVGASDIHVEPEENYIKIRFRLDGVLHELAILPNEIYHLFLSRIKLLSGMKLNIKTIAQDGRFQVKINGVNIEIRVSVLPSTYAESIVMRILNPASIHHSIEELGIPPKLLNIIMREARKPNGMILTTGPTGSGKTTTLYSLLAKIATKENKVLTIEDPIEYHLEDIVQTQIDHEHGYNFASGLRAALRQDPDVVMVGEIRDAETAETAIQAAETGHLVLSTLHTNNAAGTFPRLVDLGVNRKLITSALTLSLAQRLIRKLCPDCKEEIEIPTDYQEIVQKIIDGIVDPNDKVAIGKIYQAHEGGCVTCNGTGYKGRVGLYEGIRSDEAIEKVLREEVSERDILRAARSQGIMTMKEYGMTRVLAGMTSLTELERVVDIFADDM